MRRIRWNLAFFSSVIALGLIVTSLASGQTSDPIRQTSAGVFSQAFEILTPTDGVDFTSFMQDLVKSVRQKWFVKMPEDAMLGRKGRVVVRFGVKKDGSLADGSPAVETSSGRKDLDGAAVSAIKGAAPFKHFPSEFAGPSIELRLTFLYNLPTESTK